MVKSKRWIFFFILPSLIVLIFIAGWPLLRTFLMSFTDASLDTIEVPKWIGFDNYQALLEDPDWWVSVKNTLLFALVSVSLETIIGLGIALVLNSKIRARGILRAAILIPWAIPTIVSAKMWAWMFHDLYGVVNEFLTWLSVTQEPIAWLADDSLALATVVLVDVWKTTPFMTLLILAGLQTVPSNIYEAARIDGIGPARQFFSITLPLVMPAILVAMVFRLLDALRCFDLPYVLTSNSPTTALVSIYARQQLVDFQDFGYGSAVSFSIFMLIALATLLLIGSNRKRMGLES